MRVTELRSEGGFLRSGNATLLLGWTTSRCPWRFGHRPQQPAPDRAGPDRVAGRHGRHLAADRGDLRRGHRPCPAGRGHQALLEPERRTFGPAGASRPGTASPFVHGVEAHAQRSGLLRATPRGRRRLLVGRHRPAADHVARLADHEPGRGGIGPWSPTPRSAAGQRARARSASRERRAALESFSFLDQALGSHGSAALGSCTLSSPGSIADDRATSTRANAGRAFADRGALDLSARLRAGAPVGPRGACSDGASMAVRTRPRACSARSPCPGPETAPSTADSLFLPRVRDQAHRGHRGRCSWWTRAAWTCTLRSQRVLPEFRGERKERVTAWHVLTHTSGIPDMDMMLYLRSGRTPQRHVRARVRDAAVLRARVALLLRVRLVLPAGGAHRRLTGMSFPDALRRRVLPPVGAHDVTLRPTCAARADRARPRGGVDNRIVRELMLRFLARATLPGGGLWGRPRTCSASVRAAAIATAAPEPRILSQAAIDEMTREQTAGILEVPRTAPPASRTTRWDGASRSGWHAERGGRSGDHACASRPRRPPSRTAAHGHAALDRPERGLVFVFLTPGSTGPPMFSTLPSSIGPDARKATAPSA